MFPFIARAFLCVAFVVAVSVPSVADLVLVIGNGEIETGSEPRDPIVVAQGASGSIGFSVRAEGEGFSLNGYNIYFDVGPVGTGADGFAAPAGIVFTGASAVAGGFNNDTVVNFDLTTAATADFFSGGNGNYDFVVDDSRSGGLSLSDGDSTALLDLNFNVSSTAAIGIYDVLFVNAPTLLTEGQFTTSPNSRILQAFSGSIQIVSAVPEPSCFALVAFGLVVPLMGRRRIG